MAAALKRNTKRTKIYTLEDVQVHSRTGDCWIVHDNKIYDVSQFANDHPGGDDLILAYGGRDVTTIMADPVEHSHSDSAYELLQDYQIGIVGAEERITNENFVFTDHFSPEDTEVSDDFERNKFLDLNRPLVMQMWRSDFSKSFYLQQVHQPRHLPHPARLFGPSYLEVFTKTQWWVVPMIWMPIALFLFARSVQQQQHQQKNEELPMAISRTLGLFFIGNILWTILEYTLHRFLFHVEYYLPDQSWALTLHFLLHGIHHYLPMDRLRLVMPPLLFTLLSYPFTRLAYFLFSTWVANGIISGAFFFYVGYDCFHYAMHHTKLPDMIKGQKSWHMEHHYKEPNLGFGVTLPLWDYVFHTTFDEGKKRRDKAQRAM